MLFFAWNVNQTFEKLEAKQSIVIHLVKAIATPTLISIAGRAL